MNIPLLDLVGHSSFMLTAISFCLRDMILLRAVAIVSGLVGVIYNYLIPVGPLWIPMFWLSFFILINAWRIVGLFLDRRSIAFNDEETELFGTVFRNFTPVEFMKLMRIGEWRDADSDDTLAAEGEELGGLILLFNGEVAIERDGVEIGHARDGAMIGEISFIQGGAATATVTAECPCRYVFWSGDELRRLLHRNPSMDVAMKHIFSADMMRKLTA
jgi:hypothetical protein